jgi:hypothetical protein
MFVLKILISPHTRTYALFPAAPLFIAQTHLAKKPLSVIVADESVDFIRI